MATSLYDDVMWLKRILAHKRVQQLVKEGKKLPEFKEQHLRNDEYVYLCEAVTYPGAVIPIWYPERCLKLTQMLRHYKKQFDDSSDVTTDTGNDQESGDEEELGSWADMF